MTFDPTQCIVGRNISKYVLVVTFSVVVQSIHPYILYCFVALLPPTEPTMVPTTTDFNIHTSTVSGDLTTTITEPSSPTDSSSGSTQGI